MFNDFIHVNCHVETGVIVQVSLLPGSMVGCLVLLLTLIVWVVCVNAMKVARSNPVEYLRTE